MFSPAVLTRFVRMYVRITGVLVSGTIKGLRTVSAVGGLPGSLLYNKWYSNDPGDGEMVEGKRV